MHNSRSRMWGKFGEFNSSSKDLFEKHPKGLLQRGELERSPCHRFSAKKNLATDFLQVFYDQKYFQRYSVTKRPFADLLWPQFLLQGTCYQNAFDRSFVVKRSMTGLLLSKTLYRRPEDLLKVSCGRQYCYRFSVARGLSIDHLWPEDLW